MLAVPVAKVEAEAVAVEPEAAEEVPVVDGRDKAEDAPDKVVVDQVVVDQAVDGLKVAAVDLSKVTNAFVKSSLFKVKNSQDLKTIDATALHSIEEPFFFGGCPLRLEWLDLVRKMLSFVVDRSD